MKVKQTFGRRARVETFDIVFTKRSFLILRTKDQRETVLCLEVHLFISETERREKQNDHLKVKPNKIWCETDIDRICWSSQIIATMAKGVLWQEERSVLSYRPWGQKDQQVDQWWIYWAWNSYENLHWVQTLILLKIYHCTLNLKALIQVSLCFLALEIASIVT